ncbi:carbohydrate-binding protein [Paenibacillus sp. VCA1]|uniref:carbohydrate-binding protein n=1 Tax=Paenibacillus sp. VCA1 TaxID=3039148 RepID=UPI0028716DAC|nr:carbohydrate-binding protein [Paenibacillus sp. VCA1]MDR9854208.1 carbohydrate-binding protein [Paenibacillus sp. VCA1]
MDRITLEVLDSDGTVKAAVTDDGQVQLVYSGNYQPGDEIVLKSESKNVYLIMQLDDAIGPAFIYLKEHEFRFPVPFGEKKFSYSPKAFSGELHALNARLAAEDEINAYKNVALNAYDHHDNDSCFPHASANVETRGESVFAARNAINGNSMNYSHGKWPFESWGINQRKDAEITVHFGRTVDIDKVAITIRADFPHDNYWERVTLVFSDGSKHVADLVKTDRKQMIVLEPRKVEWVTLKDLIQSNEPSPFPALSQFEVFGREAAKGE